MPASSLVLLEHSAVAPSVLLLPYLYHVEMMGKQNKANQSYARHHNSAITNTRLYI